MGSEGEVATSAGEAGHGLMKRGSFLQPLFLLCSSCGLFDMVEKTVRGDVHMGEVCKKPEVPLPHPPAGAKKKGAGGWCRGALFDRPGSAISSGSGPA